VDSSSASVVHPAATRQSAPRRVRHRAYTETATKPAMKQCRHQLGVPCKPTSRAVSAGMLWVATSCCCSLIAPTKPNAWEPKPISPSSASSARLSPAAPATRRRSRLPDPFPPAPRIRNGNASPAVALIATPATSVAAPARNRGFAPAVSSSAAPSVSSSSVSLCAPPTASSSSTGFRPTKAAAKRDELPSGMIDRPRDSRAAVAEAPAERFTDRSSSAPAARAISAIAARLAATASAFRAHNPPASPSGAIA
jgi:hypothetical protein